jgi:hypothetical protein
MYTEYDDTGDLHCSEDAHRKWWQRRFTLLWWCTQKMMTKEIYTALMIYTENDDTGDLHCSDNVHRKWWHCSDDVHRKLHMSFLRSLKFQPQHN